MQLRGEMHRQVTIGGIERGALGVLRVETGEVEKQIAVHIRRGEEDRPNFTWPGVCAAIRCSAQQAAIAHAVRDQVHLLRPPCTVKSTRKSVIARSLASMLASSTGRHAATRGPTEERRCSGTFRS